MSGSSHIFLIWFEDSFFNLLALLLVGLSQMVLALPSQLILSKEEWYWFSERSIDAFSQILKKLSVPNLSSWELVQVSSMEPFFTHLNNWLLLLKNCCLFEIGYLPIVWLWYITSKTNFWPYTSQFIYSFLLKNWSYRLIATSFVGIEVSVKSGIWKTIKPLYYDGLMLGV